jgi:hypothetical protein
LLLLLLCPRACSAFIVVDRCFVIKSIAVFAVHFFAPECSISNVLLLRTKNQEAQGIAGSGTEEF